MESLSAKTVSSLGLDSPDWQAVTIWAITAYGLMQFLALNAKQSRFPFRQSKTNDLQAEFASTYFIPQDAVKKAFDAPQSGLLVSNSKRRQGFNQDQKNKNKKQKKSLLN